MLQWPMLNRALEYRKVIDHVHILDIGLELACNGGSCREISFAFERTRCMNLTCKLVPVQYQKDEYGLLACITMLQLYTCTTSTKLSEAKPITTRSYTFSDALRQLHVCKSSFDWFTWLSKCVLCDWPKLLIWFWFYKT